MTAQTALAVAAFPALAFAPPAQGRMLLVPLTPGAASRLPAVALSHDIKLVGQGPMRGSLVIEGDRGAVLRPLLAAGVIVMSAPALLCGGLSEKGGA